MNPVEAFEKKTANAQLTAHYAADDLIGRLVVAAVDLGGRNVAGFLSEVLLLGVPDGSEQTVLLAVGRKFRSAAGCTEGGTVVRRYLAVE